MQLVAKKKTSLARVSIDGKKPEDAMTVSVIKKSGGSIVDLYEKGLAKMEELK